MKEPPVYNTAALGGVPEGGDRDHPGNILHLLDGGLEGLPGEVLARRGKPGNQTGPPTRGFGPQNIPIWFFMAQGHLAPIIGSFRAWNSIILMP